MNLSLGHPCRLCSILYNDQYCQVFCDSNGLLDSGQLCLKATVADTLANAKIRTPGALQTINEWVGCG
jgi:hypothetical protein